MNKQYQKLCLTLGYQFNDMALLERALTHRSCVSQGNNERLEFLGDSILNFLVGKALFKQLSDAQEGDLSRLRANLVRGETLAEIANELDLSQYVRLGVGEQKSGGSQRDSILADAFEAIIAAIYIDADIDTCETCVLNWYGERIAHANKVTHLKDPKTRLQEYLQAGKRSLPKYKVVKTEGSAHQQVFFVKCTVEGYDVETQGTGSSKRRAEQEAALRFFEEITGAIL